MTCSGAHLLEDFGSSWGLSELAKSRFIGPVGVWEAHKSRSDVPVGVRRPPRMLRSHDLSCLAVFGGLPGGFLTCSGAPQAPLGGSWRLLGALAAPQVTIHRSCRCLGGSQLTICRACRCLEASRHAPKFRSIVPGGVWRPPGWLVDVCGSSTSSSWRILEALGSCRSLQKQDSSALSVSGRLTSHDLSCLSVFGSLPESSEVMIYRACRCLEASHVATAPSEPASAQLRPT